jgi:hypothetical protein
MPLEKDLNEEFKKDPTAFLKDKVIIVCEETDSWYDTPGTYQFTLVHRTRNIIDLKPRIAITGSFIYAYYLPWATNTATSMDLGSKADFFFTSEMTNCRFSVLADDTKMPKVAHVAGNTNKHDRNKWEVRDKFVDELSKARVRRFSISGSVGKGKKHEYGGGNVSSAFTFGTRDDNGDWKFFAQITKGCLSSMAVFSTDLQILGYVEV